MLPDSRLNKVCGGSAKTGGKARIGIIGGLKKIVTFWTVEAVTEPEVPVNKMS